MEQRPVHPAPTAILPRMDTLWTPWRYQYVSTADSSARQGVPPQLAAWPGDTRCVFCNLLQASAFAVDHGMASEEADRAANIVHRGNACFVCLNAFPYNSGHAMVLPYEHTNELARLEPSTAQEIMALVQRLEQAFRSIYRPDGINLGMNLGKAAGAGVVGHLHMHMLPRWLGDTNFMTVIGETRVLPESLEVTWQRLHAALQGLSE
jgi:ATP adenylyltransferase